MVLFQFPITFQNCSNSHRVDQRYVIKQAGTGGVTMVVMQGLIILVIIIMNCQLMVQRLSILLWIGVNNALLCSYLINYCINKL